MGRVVIATPRQIYSEKETQYPLHRRLGGPHGRSGRVRKISPPPGFDPRTTQPAASRYCDYANLNLKLAIRLHLQNAGWPPTL
jgi:hypothetical protein